MPKIERRSIYFLLIFILMTSVPAFAADDENEGPIESSLEMKARQAHELGSSAINVHENWRALYFQNQQIIQLLKQIRDSLDVIKSQGSKGNTEEKSVARQ